MEITSLTNAKVKQWAKLKEKKYREKDQRFLVEGEHLIEEAARAGLVEAVLVEIGKAHTFVEYPVYEVTKDILAEAGKQCIRNLDYGCMPYAAIP